MSITLNLIYQDGTTEPLAANTNQTLHVLYVHVATLPPGISDRLVYHNNILLPDDNTKIGVAGIADGDTIYVYEFSASQKADYDTFVNTTPEPLGFIASLPAANRSRGLMLETMKTKPASFVFAAGDPSLQDEEINTLAVQGDGLLVKGISSPSESVSIAAVTQNPRAIRNIINPTEATVVAAVSIDGTALGLVPSTSRTAAMATAAVTQNGLALQEVPVAIQTSGIITTAVNNDGRAIQYADEALLNVSIVTDAINQNPYAILSAPDIYKNNDALRAIAINAIPGIASLLL